MPKLTLLVGPPGSGKTTLAQSLLNSNTEYVNQDTQTKAGHLLIFNAAIGMKKDIIVDRMNFDRVQRGRYLKTAIDAGYETKIIVLHENKTTCMVRCIERQNHPTIQDEATAGAAINTFFKMYERPSLGEADEVEYRYPKTDAKCIVFDIDGTLANIDHRLAHVKGLGKKNWKAFFDEMGKDDVNEWCFDLIKRYVPSGYKVFLASGRPDNYRGVTQNWLEKQGVDYTYLFMRERNDHRDDTVAKENILDFEILTRATPLFVVDDRKRVVEMWRRRGITCLHCAEGEF